MPKLHRCRSASRSLFACAAHLAVVLPVLAFAPQVKAQDLTITAVQINQAVQFGATQLIGNQTTIVRVTIGTGGVAVPNVDAILRMSVNNVPVAGAPVFSINGPITAPAFPSLNNLNDTLNFMVLPPISSDVDFVVEVNPNRNVVETNYANNTFTVPNKVFLCRRVIECPYVPINYTLGGGLPPANLMEPGIGDGFVRGIYSDEWNYHKSPLPPLTWSQNINGSDIALLNTLNDIRVNQLPAIGQPLSGLIFGFLPGNPFSGNGETNAIPGTTAFGNTDQTRSQRTTAHELGHAFGLVHNTTTIGTVGFDEEQHLFNPTGLGPVHLSTQNDIMVAGLLTFQAWVNSNSYNVALNDSRMACPAGDGDPGVPMVPVLRVSGVITHDTRAVQLDPVTRIARGNYTSDNPNGDVRIQLLNAAGNVIWSVGFRSDTARERCEPDANGHVVFSPTGSIYALVPETVGGEAVQEVRIVDTATGNLLVNRVRSGNSPQAHILGIRQAPVAGQRGGEAKAALAGERLVGRLRVTWIASDPDGDALTHTLLYSPDAGESWYPLVVNTADNAFEFDSADIPASHGRDGILRLVSSDGLNVHEDDEGGIPVGAGTPPETFLITPNDGNVFAQLAPIAFHGTSWDKESQLLDNGSMVWTSSLDGQIGTGRLFVKANLSPGTHVITLTGTDAASMSSSRQITITITPRVVITPDCNGNFVNDLVDIQNGTSLDVNGNGIPDECESLPCPADITGDGVVSVNDLLAVITSWGPCGAPPCPADIAPPGGNGQVNVDDLLAVITSWGDCP